MEQKKDNHYMRNEHNRHNAQGQQNNAKAIGFGYIVRKAEKLTTALYLVSDIMSDREPMKWTMRETGVEILSDVTVSATEGKAARITDLRQVMKKIEKVVSFLDIAQSTRLLSEMNANVLKKEYLGLRRDVESEWNRTYEQSRNILNESFFHVAKTEELSLEAAPTVAPVESIIHTHDRSVGDAPAPVVREQIEVRNGASLPTTSNHVNTTPLAPVVPMTGGKREEIKMAFSAPRVHTERLPEVKPQRAVPTLRDAIAHARTDVIRDDRRKIIFALIKQKPELTVKDITKSIPGVSEKTIQRELLAMVAEGILEKHGERRWSTYGVKM